MHTSILLIVAVAQSMTWRSCRGCIDSLLRLCWGYPSQGYVTRPGGTWWPRMSLIQWTPSRICLLQHLRVSYCLYGYLGVVDFILSYLMWTAGKYAESVPRGECTNMMCSCLFVTWFLIYNISNRRLDHVTLNDVLVTAKTKREMDLRYNYLSYFFSFNLSANKYIRAIIVFTSSLWVERH